MNAVSLGIFLLIIVLIAHLVEEIRTDFRKKLPIGEMPLPVFVSINILLYAFCFTTFILSLISHPAAVTLAWIFAVGMAFNGFGHVGFMLAKRKYFPGGITAFPLMNRPVKPTCFSGGI
jgi:hypothetical protein